MAVVIIVYYCLRTERQEERFLKSRIDDRTNKTQATRPVCLFLWYRHQRVIDLFQECIYVHIYYIFSTIHPPYFYKWTSSHVFVYIYVSVGRMFAFRVYNGHFCIKHYICRVVASVRWCLHKTKLTSVTGVPHKHTRTTKTWPHHRAIEPP